MTTVIWTDPLGNKVELRKGLHIRVRYIEGTQRARVTKITRHGNVYVRKYSKRSDCWTNPVRLWPEQLLGMEGGQ